MADVLPSEELLDEASDFGTLRPGTRLGRYELLVPIARGGMARVWAARLHGQRGFSKIVAIKTILPHLACEPEFERMFLDEARIAAGVHHPNVCEIYELGEDKRTLYLAMEWVSGDSFSRVLRASGKTEALDPRVVARVVADASAGLHAAHETTDDDGRPLGVVHRDLSPHNILLTADGVAKVADFGVAKALNQLHEATSAGQLKGKIAYMAPEQVTSGTVDRRSDIFSLGCVLYEASTGQRPFRGEGEAQIMHAVLKGEFPAPTSLLRGFPQELERIILRAMSPQPILRFPTAERMRFALEEFLARGQLVTQSNVAQVVRARIGDPIEKRKERIRQASSAGDQSESPGHTPSNQRQDHRSGVKAAIVRPTIPSDPPQRMTTPLVPPGVAPMFAPGVPYPTGVGPMMNPEAPFGHAPPPPQVGQVAQYTPPPYSHLSYPSHPAHLSQPSHPAHLSYPSHPAHLSQPSHPAHLSQPSHPAYPSQSAFPAPYNPNYSYPGNAVSQPTMPPPSGPLVAMSGDWSNHGVRVPTIPPAGLSSGGLSGGMALYDQGGAEPYPTPPPPGAPQAGVGSYFVAAGIGLLVAALIGGGGFFVWRTRANAVARATPATSVTSSASPPHSAAASPAPPPAASVPAPARVELAFRTSPTEATIVVDGRELGAARTIPRPVAGQTVTVVAAANGFESTTIFVDYFTTSPIEITLKAAPPVAVEAPVGSAPPASSSPSSPSSPADKKTEKHDKARGERKDSTPLPANPY